MEDNKLHTPEGVRDVLWCEYKQKQYIENNVRKSFDQFGFEPIQTPTFEFMEVYSDERGSIKPQHMYKFFDRDGNTLVLRPDMTPAIARVIASRSDDEFPFKVYSIGNTFRYHWNFSGKPGEINQAGAEWIGDGSVETDAQMIVMGIHTLKNCGLKEFQIDIGEVNFFKGLLEEANLSENLSSQLTKLIDEKNYYAVEDLLEKEQIKSSLKDLFLQLPSLFGKADILQRALSMTNNPQAQKAVKRLLRIHELIKSYNLEKYIAFDLSMIKRLNYYTGVIFRGYTYGTGESILLGGRYDNLLGQFDSCHKAIGFGIKLDGLLPVLLKQKVCLPITYVDILLLFREDQAIKAYEMGCEYRERGLRVSSMVMTKDIKTYENYALKKHIKKIIMLQDDIKSIDVYE